MVFPPNRFRVKNDPQGVASVPAGNGHNGSAAVTPASEEVIKPEVDRHDLDGEVRALGGRRTPLYVGTPEELKANLAAVGYQCLDFIAHQMALVLNTPCGRVRALLLEGPSGCGKSFMAKCLTKILNAKFMCLS